MASLADIEAKVRAVEHACASSMATLLMETVSITTEAAWHAQPRTNIQLFADKMARALTGELRFHMTSEDGSRRPFTGDAADISDAVALHWDYGQADFDPAPLVRELSRTMAQLITHPFKE